MSKIEKSQKITGFVLVGVTLVACSDQEASISPSRAALRPSTTPTAQVTSVYKDIGTETPEPINTKIPKNEAIEAPRATVVYESPDHASKEEIIIGKEVQESEEFFKPNHELDLKIMHLTELEEKNLKNWRDLIEKQAEYYGWDANLAAAMMIVESGGVNGLESHVGAVGLWGILANHNGSPDKETLNNPFINGTWHFAKMVDLCKKQGYDLRTSILMYGGWTKETPAALDYLHDILITAGYMEEDEQMLIPNLCQSIEQVPAPPTQSELQVVFN